LANVGINAEAEQNHLEQRHDEREKQGREIAADMEGFLVENGAKASEEVTH
jgi:hypothetical protein